MPSGLILVVNRVGFVGGAERVLLAAGKVATYHGYRVVLACPAPSPLADAAVRNGMEIEPVAIDRTAATLSPGRLFGQARRLVAGTKQIHRLVKTLRPDLIHVHHPVGALYVIKAARAFGVPVLLHVHETLPVSVAYAWLARIVYPQCRHFVGVSEKSCEMVRAYGGRADAVMRIYNGVRPDFLADVKPVDELRGIGPHIGIFGVIEPRKGQEFFLAAAQRVLTVHPQAQFWIVGPLSYADNRSYLDQLQAMAARASMASHVHFTGLQENVPNWMAGMDAVVLASTGFESLPTVIIEAAALGRPVVATDVGGVREILHDGETGLVVPPRKPDDIAAAILRVLGGEGRAMGEQARADIRERFSQAQFESGMLACYRQVVAGTKIRAA